MPRVPWYIDENARHEAPTMRLLAYMGLAGREGVMGPDHLKVTALTTPGPQIQVAPGAFGVLNRASGGAFEAYVDKVGAAMVKDVNPTDATVGGRTDLVIARILNPYVSESGSSIPTPADPENGPYWDIQVIEGVSPNINSVTAHNPNWSAIPLARIVRPANTGIVQQNNIIELRSLVDLSGERLIIIDNPPPTPPPIASAIWTNTMHFPTVTELDDDTTAWTDWPANAYWDVPIPSWAAEVDIFGSFNPQFDNDVWGELRLNFGGNPGPAIMFDENVSPLQQYPGPQQVNIPLGGTYTIPSNQRGKVVRMKLQAHFLDPSNHRGDLATRNGVYLSVFLSFKRYPY
jgi:hypothetical protein